MRREHGFFEQDSLFAYCLHSGMGYFDHLYRTHTLSFKDFIFDTYRILRNNLGLSFYFKNQRANFLAVFARNTSGNYFDVGYHGQKLYFSIKLSVVCISLVLLISSPSR